jgi:hypothetical protein
MTTKLLVIGGMPATVLGVVDDVDEARRRGLFRHAFVQVLKVEAVPTVGTCDVCFKDVYEGESVDQNNDYCGMWTRHEACSNND